MTEAYRSDGLYLGFKSVAPENVLDTDPVVRDLVTLNHLTGEVRPQEARDWITMLMSLKLSSRVPYEVQKTFAFSQGAMCYAHWYYPVLTLGTHDMLRIAEFAAVQCCKQRKLTPRRFKDAIDALVAERAIAAEDTPRWNALRQFRNRATHPAWQNIYGFAQSYQLVKVIVELMDGLAWLEPSFRPIEAIDRTFVENVYFETERAIIERQSGWRGDDVERRKFEEHYDPANTNVIVVNGQDIGWLTVRRLHDRIDLEGIYLTKEWQGRGIGSAVIGGLIAEAAASEAPIHLSTAKINRALGLYFRLGFRHKSEDEFRVYMEHDAGRGATFRDVGSS